MVSSRLALAGFAAAALAVPSPSLAANLSFTATLAVQIATLQPIVLSGSDGAVVNGSGGAGHLTGLALPGSKFATTALIVDVTDPGVFPIEGVQLTAHNAAGNFAGSGGAGFGGVMPFLGAAKICLYGACGSSNNISNLIVPLTIVGQGGGITVMGAVNLSVVGAPWTTGTAAIGTITMMGGVSPLSNTGAPSGTVTLVTPFFVQSAIGALSLIPGFGILTMHFVPEPATLAFLGAGIAGLAALGQRRRAR